MSAAPKCRNGWCRLPLKLVNSQLVCPRCQTDEARVTAPVERYRNAEDCRTSRRLSAL